MMVTNLEGVRSLRRAGTVSAKPRRHGSVQGKNYLPLLEQARQYYDTLDRFRRERRRTRRYVEGDQWSELIPNVKDRFGGSMIREEDFIKQDGRVPFKQNILAQLVNNIIGQYRKNPNKSNVLARARERQKASEMLTNAVQSVLDINEASELDALNLREFVVSGFCEGKVTYEWNAARQMPEGGRILIIGSVNGDRMPVAGMAAYAASKSALQGMARGLARDFGPRGITINVVQPGPIDTDANPANGPMRDMLHGFMAIKRHGQPEEVAGMVAWLAGPEASFVTGAMHTIDGAFGA